MRGVLGSVTAAVAVLLLSGCGDPAGTGPSAPGPAPSTSASASVPAGSPSTPAPASPPTLRPTPLPTGKLPGPGTPAPNRPLTLDGVVEAGVEAGCRVLSAQGAEYLLLDGPTVPLGVPVRIKGVVLTGVSTTCQQGTPLRVLDVQRR